MEININSFRNRRQTAFQQTIYLFAHVAPIADALIHLESPVDHRQHQAIESLKTMIRRLGNPTAGRELSGDLREVLLDADLIMDYPEGSGHDVCEKLDYFLDRLDLTAIDGSQALPDIFTSQRRHTVSGQVENSKRVATNHRETQESQSTILAKYGDLLTALKKEHCADQWEGRIDLSLALDDKAMNCPSATKYVKWSRTSRVMYFDIRRTGIEFTDDGEIIRTAMEGLFTFPVTLDMTPYCTSDVEGSTQYRLAMIHTFIRDEDGWNLTFQTVVNVGSGSSDWLVIDSQNRISSCTEDEAVQGSYARDPRDRKAAGLCYVRV